MRTYSVVGKSIAKIDAFEKVTGRVKFGADIRLPYMLWGKILRSRYPHARILNIDVSRARKLVGVKAVVTGKDTPGVRYGPLIRDETLFARDRVRFVGEVLAAVAAIDEETAQEALELIRVDYEELPAVFDPIEAMSPDAPLIHEELQSYTTIGPVTRYGNVCTHIKLHKGDVDDGFRGSDLIFEDTFRTQMVHQGYLEPHATVANVDSAGRVTVWTTTQTPFGIRRALSETLQIPLSKIRVIGTAIGGGFGGKEVLIPEPSCVLLAQKIGHPVKIALSIEEDLTCSNPRHPCIIELKTGVSKDGTILAREAKLIFDTGAYAGGGPLACSCGVFLVAGPYKIPNVKVDGYWVYTNKLSCVTCRAPSDPQVTFAFESQMDIIAQRLGLDPLEIRLKNAVENGDTSATGQIYQNVSLKETLGQAAKKVNWGKPVAEKNRGRGLACGRWGSAGGASSASIKLNEDGSIIVSTGAVDLGTGSSTILAQIAAEELGLTLEDISMVTADTDTTPYDSGSFGSRVAYNMGNAVRRAALEVKEQLFSLASARLEANPEDLDLANKRIFVKGSPAKGINLTDLARASYFATGGPILGHGSFLPQTPAYDRKTVDTHYFTTLLASTFVTEGAEVEVDAETGKINVVRLVAAQDVGFALNPLAVEGQIDGGVAQGIGFALTEEFHFNKGFHLNPSFLDYKMPTAVDVPRVESVIIEEHAGSGPFGAKGVGEPPIVPTAPALANAVCNALGVRIKELPITPEKIFKALRVGRKDHGPA